MAKTDRVYKFEIGQAVRIKDGVAGIAGEIVDRMAEPDHTEQYDIKTFPDGRCTSKSRLVPMNSYMVKFTDKNGRAATAWWNEDAMIAG